ncbi:MAG: FtsK/SpoIIIE domain-containing protein [Pseudomonadota bacterium]
MRKLPGHRYILPSAGLLQPRPANARHESVTMHELLTDPAFVQCIPDSLSLALGKDAAGAPVIVDLASISHLLITDEGRSNMEASIDAIMLSLLFRLTPDVCRVLMIDPKMLELTAYDDIPHLLAPIITEPALAIQALSWLVQQTDDRHRMMADAGVRDFAAFNRKAHASIKGVNTRGLMRAAGGNRTLHGVRSVSCKPLPQIVVIVSELADLMMEDGSHTQRLIESLCKNAGSAGIHLILAAQLPTRDVITTGIEDCLPNRLSFSAPFTTVEHSAEGSERDYETGKTEMIYSAANQSTIRVRQTLSIYDEVSAVANHWRAQGSPDFVAEVIQHRFDQGPPSDDSPPDPDNTAIYRRAIALIAEKRSFSTSWLQRQLRLGYNSTGHGPIARIVQKMEQGKLIAPAKAPDQYKVLATIPELNLLISADDVQYIGGEFYNSENINAPHALIEEYIDEKPHSSESKSIESILKDSLQGMFERAEVSPSEQRALVDKITTQIYELVEDRAHVQNHAAVVVGGSDFPATLPTAPPEKYAGLRSSETPPEFIKRVYAPWLGKGLDRAALRKLDPALIQSLYNWLRKNEMPDDLNLPTKSEVVSVRIDELRAQAPGGNINQVVGDFTAREAARIRSAINRREK